MPRWWFRLGGVCEQLQEWKRAYDAYAKALALNPSCQDALAAQARVKPKAGL
jgi:cytochrome c-type biogenesis protein CcmH/NrfG